MKTEIRNRITNNGMAIAVMVVMLLVGLNSCQEDMHGALSTTDQLALDGMRSSYGQALNENEAFKSAIVNGDSLEINLHDSLFNHYDKQFEEHHLNYSHNNNHDDHHHANGMHMISNSILGHVGVDGHHNLDHQEMHELEAEHQTMFEHFHD
ncbi:MAG: hypothetical protein JXQ96_20160 [Cyclobacteriaceae bacterium]